MKKGALLETLETVLVVTVITVLIWLYAEGETILTENRTVTIQFVTPTPDLALAVAGQAPGIPGKTTTSVSATLQASSGDWARISEWARSQIVEIEVQAPPPDTYEHEQTINLLDALNNSPLADVRAFVKEVTPATKTVRVQKLETVEMGLRVEPGELELSSEEPTFAPDKIRVQMPSQYAVEVRNLNLKLTAHLDRIEDPDTLAEDTQKTASVELSLPPELQGRPHITLGQETVNVTFILDKLTREIDLDGVQVRLNISDDLSKYIFEIEETQRFIPVVTIKGPEEIINRIETQVSEEVPSGRDLVRAQITIKHSDLLEQPPYSAPLYIDVPDGVTILEPLPGQTFITYKVTDPTEQN